MLNGLMTFASAINAIKKNNYSWAFIQCYYTIFYLAEAEKSHRVRGSKTAKKIQSVFRGESVFLRAQRTKMRGSE